MFEVVRLKNCARQIGVSEIPGGCGETYENFMWGFKNKTRKFGYLVSVEGLNAWDRGKPVSWCRVLTRAISRDCSEI